MAEWYIEQLGETIGPITGKQLLERVRKGDIVANTPLRKDDSQWVPARDVGGLFEAAGGNQSRQVSCPYCGAPIDLPPTRCSKCRRQVDQAYEVVFREGPDGESPPADTTESEQQQPKEQVRKEKKRSWLSKIRKHQE